MNVDAINIINAISCEDELTRMLPLIKDIALIEYDGNSIDGSCGIAEYMKANGIDTAAISCIIPKTKYIVDIIFVGKMINWIIVQSISVNPNTVPNIIPIFLFFIIKYTATKFDIPFTINKHIPENI